MIRKTDFKLNSDEYVESSSDEGDSNTEDASDDNISASTPCYVALSGIDWQLTPPVKNKIQLHNIIRSAPGLVKKHMAATPKETF